MDHMIYLKSRFDQKSASLKLLQQVLENLEWPPHVQIFIYSIIFRGWMWGDSVHMGDLFLFLLYGINPSL